MDVAPTVKPSGPSTASGISGRPPKTWPRPLRRPGVHPPVRASVAAADPARPIPGLSPRRACRASRRTTCATSLPPSRSPPACRSRWGRRRSGLSTLSTTANIYASISRGRPRAAVVTIQRVLAQPEQHRTTGGLLPSALARWGRASPGRRRHRPGPAARRT
ncbi:hypothetical protein ACU686_13615 [Yinghuangia aomiensis]